MSQLPANPTPEETASPMQSKTPTAKHKFEGHKNNIQSFVFLHDNAHVVSGSLDGTMRKWDCETGRLIGEPWKGNGGYILALALSPDGKTIACGREDGSVQRWDTDGKMIKTIWTGHSDWVRSLSWSPSGGHIASGSDDGTILIREAESGKVEVGPIKTNQDWVLSLAYSPLGDRIASCGNNKTICIWDSNTGKLLVGPIEDLGNSGTSVVWSLDGSKLYSASDKFARVFDSGSGTLLHRFQHDNSLYSVALSPKHNVLACVGFGGVVQLWDTESHKPLGQSFPQDGRKELYCVSFSPDGQYLAYGGYDNKITLWMVQDIALQLTVHAPMSKIQDVTQEETQPEPPSSSFPNGDEIMEEDRNNPYDNFFASSQSSLTPAPCDPSRKRRLQNIFSNLSVLRPPVNHAPSVFMRPQTATKASAPQKKEELEEEKNVVRMLTYLQ
ncbi:WD40 repeat-like protein [Rhizopogon vinicolor AM-OR11-026]|uniref:WD40 repeat-like protein n=1 Tax=Rhizopogon vinicolor AM-OR11-026 TaxID=1314800 RepID=A0A1B7MEH5_9AGAM|nr:WD40 repeat-like protein [Rhizopogon vinicolor AM-OR11-026]